MSILVPIDPSEPSRAAVWLAGLLADRGDHELVLFHAADPRPSLDTLAALHRIAEPLRRQGLRVRLRTVEAQPADAISAEASSRDCAWVVMGTRGRTDGENSLAMVVMRTSKVPVVAVRPGAAGRESGVVGWVADARGPTAALADVVAAVENARTVRMVAAPERSPPVLPAENSVQQPISSVVIDYAPDCANAGWCRRMFRESQARVILVRSERCGCEADGR